MDLNSTQGKSRRSKYAIERNMNYMRKRSKDLIGNDANNKASSL